MLSEYKSIINSFTFNDTNSIDMGLFITEYSEGDIEPIIDTTEIPARGTIINDNRIDDLDNPLLGNRQIKYTCCMDVDESQDYAEAANKVYKWLYSNPFRYSKLQDTYYDDCYRIAHVGLPLSLEAVAKRLLGVISVQFSAKPYKRTIAGDNPIEMTTGGSIINPEGFTSYPYMKIEGSGDITIQINNRSHTFKGVEDFLEIDSEIMNAYKVNLLQNQKMITGPFPKLVSGTNNIDWIGNVSKLTIIPRWVRI